VGGKIPKEDCQKKTDTVPNTVWGEQKKDEGGREFDTVKDPGEEKTKKVCDIGSLHRR